MPSSASPRRLAWVAWGTICVVWGTTYLAIKVALATIPPFLMGGLRYIVAGVLLAMVTRGMDMPLPPVPAWRELSVLGLLMLMLGNGGVAWGSQYLPSGLVAVLVGMAPFWMVGVDAAMRDGKQLAARQYVGLLVGLGGITMLAWPDITAGGATGRRIALGVLSLQIACAGWAVGSAYTRRHVVPGHVLGAAAVQMFTGGIWMLLAGTFLGEWSRLSFTPATTTALAYLIVFGSIVGFAAYSYALQHLDIAIVSLYTYVNPVIAVALGTLVLGEPFGLRMAAAAAIILTGVVIVGRPK